MEIEIKIRINAWKSYATIQSKYLIIILLKGTNRNVCLLVFCIPVLDVSAQNNSICP